MEIRMKVRTHKKMKTISHNFSTVFFHNVASGLFSWFALGKQHEDALSNSVWVADPQNCILRILNRSNKIGRKSKCTCATCSVNPPTVSVGNMSERFFCRLDEIRYRCKRKTCPEL